MSKAESGRELFADKLLRPDRRGAEQRLAEVREAVAAAAAGGGFVRADNHAEIPWQVPDGTLLAISAAMRQRGRCR
ncbi:hypothetical protein [Candidatus Electronema sp. JM]|uniref:hypothetical protein n=1 Tax=Candidatus Electronema sp. JM TaxID=3401571 RepID=UPI003AA99757